MRRTALAAFVLAGFVLALLVAPRIAAQQAPPLPKPTKAHEWLKQLVGDWEAESELSMGPGTEPLKAKSTEKCRMQSDFWMIAEGNSETSGMNAKSVFTLGYNAQKQKYVGSWIDSLTDHLWSYEGTLDDAGKVLTLDTEGPNLMNPGKTCKFREVIVLKGPDEKTFTSSILGDDGKWFTFVKSTYKRKK